MRPLRPDGRRIRRAEAPHRRIGRHHRLGAHSLPGAGPEHLAAGHGGGMRRPATAAGRPLGNPGGKPRLLDRGGLLPAVRPECGKHAVQQQGGGHGRLATATRAHGGPLGIHRAGGRHAGHPGR